MSKLLFVGDVFLGSKNTKRNLSFSHEIMKKIETCEKVIVNYEAPEIDTKSGNASNKIGPAICQNSVESLWTLFGKDKVIFNLANNHIMDYGKKGLENTLKKCGSQLLGAGMSFADVYKPFFILSEGKTIACLSLAEGGFGACKFENQSGYAYFLQPLVKELLQNLSKSCDYVIVVCHAGLEDINAPLPEYRAIYKSFIDYGANLVIAHHPHRIQGTEKYGNGEIFYSLGNFIFDNLNGNGTFNPNSIGVIFDTTNASTEIIPLCYQSGVISYSKQSLELFEKTSFLLRNNEEYMMYINSKCEAFLTEFYLGYYNNVFCRFVRIKDFIKTLLFWKKCDEMKYKFIVKRFLRIFSFRCYNEKWLYHNITAEAHYFCVRRALELQKMHAENNE